MTLKNLFLLTVVIGCGLFATILKIQKSDQLSRFEQEQQVILVPAKDLLVGMKLEKEKLAELIRKKRVNKADVPVNAILNEDELIGKTVTNNLKTDDIFMTSNVVFPPIGLMPSNGKHLFTIKLPYEHVGPWVQPGRKVDVVCKHRPPGTSLVRHVPLLRNIPVRTVDYSDKLESFSARNPIICTLTLEVNIDESQRLQEAHDAGASLRLLVRANHPGTDGGRKLSDEQMAEFFKGATKEKQNREDSKK